MLKQRTLALLALLSPLGVVRADDPGGFIAHTPPRSAESQRAAFHLPPGFEIQLVACEPDIRKPINMAFDQRGQILVTESVEYPFPAQANAGSDRVRVLGQIGSDGRARRVSTLVDELNIPIGISPIDSGTMLFSIPNIESVRSNADGGVVRTALYGPFGYDDTHGMCSSFRRWIDGWIYGCHGFVNTSNVSGRDGHSITLQSGNTYRMRSDGTRIEHYTHGQVNPFGLSFDPLGNLFSADCHSKPVYMLLRNAYYPSNGKPHDGLGFAPEMISHRHGSTGIAGIAYYAARQFPERYRDTIFIGNPVTGRINHDRLIATGSTYQASEEPDFLRCDDPWFRPVDLQVGPDGALYIADFYNCIIGHYEVPLDDPRRDRERGRIWRVVHVGMNGQEAVESLDLSKQSNEALVALLSDENLTLRTLVTHELVDRKDREIGGLILSKMNGSSPPHQRAHGLWILERRGELDRSMILALAGDDEALVRVHLAKALAEREVWQSDASPIREIVLGLLDDQDAFVRRAAAEALARHPQPSQFAPLVELLRETSVNDTHLVHVVRMALRDHLLSPGMYEQVDQLAGATQWGTLVSELSLGVPTRDAARYLLGRLPTDESNLSDDMLGQVVYHIARHLPPSSLDAFVRETGQFSKSPVLRQAAVVRSLARGLQSQEKTLPDQLQSWIQILVTDLLRSGAGPQVQDGIELARDLRLVDFHSQLATIAATRDNANSLRSQALSAMSTMQPMASEPILAAIVSDTMGPTDLRQLAARELAQPLHISRWHMLLDLVPTAPSTIAVEIAQGLAGSERGATMLLEAVSSGTASPTLLQDWLVARKLADRKIPNIDQQVATLTAGLPAPDDRLRELVRKRREQFTPSTTNQDAGRSVFERRCAVCHSLEGKGARVGPELDGVGIRGLDRLIEDILDPNRNVDKAFATSLIATSDGRVLSGMVLRDEGRQLVLADQRGQELSVRVGDIEQHERSPTSLMPTNLVESMSTSEFNDLVAYLLSQRSE